MSLEFCFVPADEDPDFELNHNLIEPGEGLLIENYASGDREVLAIECCEDDSGGNIYVIPSEGMPDTDDWCGEYAAEDLPTPTTVVSIGESDEDVEYNNGKYKGTLRIRQVSSLAITSAGLVPKGLLYPN